MLVKDVAKIFETFAPLQLQESYDNSGLCIGNYNNEVKAILLCIDVTDEVIHEAESLGCNLIISHHPLIFSGIKRITGSNLVERCVMKAIQNQISIYSAHTNLDSVNEGVNRIICEKLELKNCKILLPVTGELKKLVTFVPTNHADKVRNALFNAGAGNIGKYDNCSFNAQGFGSFRGNEDSSPFVGNKSELHIEEEIRIETIFPKLLQNKIIDALITTHPYEEVAYDIYPLENSYTKIGMGMIGELPNERSEEEILIKIKTVFNVSCIRHTKLLKKNVSKIAVCGGSGSFLLNEAKKQGATLFISADFKYHQFFDADGKLVIADIGHYESEQFTKEIFYNLLMKNFPNFAVHFSSINTNPLNYF